MITKMNKFMSDATRRDIIRLIGLAIIVAGEFTSKTKFEFLGAKVFTNTLQLVGVLILFGPAIYRVAMAKINGTKPGN